MLLGFVFGYMIVSIMIGLYASRFVKSSTDYVVAGRSLPIYITIATVFATWFGSETVLGIPATFIEEGLAGIVADPFGSSLCLILVGLLFAVPLYRMKLLTLGDFYKRRYNRTIEVLVSLFICISYLGWVSAQIVALGLVMNILSDGAITHNQGMIIGMAIVMTYTLFGGMWSVALTDFIQMSVIVIGLIIIAIFISDHSGGVGAVISHAAANEKLKFFPEWNLAGTLSFIAAWVTIGFGSIPQQDVFQRVMSAKNERVAKYGTITGGILYFFFAFIPIYLAYSALLIDPVTVQGQMADDSQIILPQLILSHTPVWIQIIFFGALISAIMSTASGTLLAPSVTFAENILKGFMPDLQDKKLLLIIRFCVVGFAGIILVFALKSDLSIFEMVENAYKVTLAGAFIPLLAGVYWSKASTGGALTSIILGVGTWIACEIIAPEGMYPPQLAGLTASAIGMVLGSLFFKQKN
ncbi:MAG: sodium:solute symporter family protein [Alphaproteobacteria bacterium]|nr:sodium:solute symporter family protein [Alphaproteobacteria bacterium]